MTFISIFLCFMSSRHHQYKLRCSFEKSILIDFSQNRDLDFRRLFQHLWEIFHSNPQILIGFFHLEIKWVISGLIRIKCDVSIAPDIIHELKRSKPPISLSVSLWSISISTVDLWSCCIDCFRLYHLDPWLSISNLARTTTDKRYFQCPWFAKFFLRNSV